MQYLPPKIKGALIPGEKLMRRYVEFLASHNSEGLLFPNYEDPWSGFTQRELVAVNDGINTHLAGKMFEEVCARNIK